MHKLDQSKILVTRPSGLEQTLIRLLSRAGASPYHLPVIEITDPASDESREYARENFTDFDIAIFISPTAVKQTLSYMGIDDSDCLLCAIGSRSCAALESAGLHVGIRPEGHDSESLLRQQELQQDKVDGKNIVVFRGENGRDLLADELRRRGARVHYAAMYDRTRPPVQLPDDLIGELDAITVSSNEGLQNLFDIVDESVQSVEPLLSTLLVVPGKRAHSLARQLGFSNIIQAANATDEAVFDALVQALSPRV